MYNKLPIIVSLILVGCEGNAPELATSGTNQLPSGSTYGDGTDAQVGSNGGQYSDITTTANSDAKLSPGGDSSGTPLPTSLKYPTWVDMDWAAFPTDPGPNYPVTGRVWVVKTTGNDSNAGTETSPLRNISTGIVKAQPGDMIKVYGGTYSECHPGDWRSLYITKDQIVLTSAPGEKVTVTPKAPSHTGLVIEGSNVVVNGINLKGFNPSIIVGLETKTQRNVVITNLTAEAATSGGFIDGIVDYVDTRSKGFPSIDGLLLKNVSMLGASLGVSCNNGPCRSWRLENVKVVGKGGSGSGADTIAFESGDNLLFDHVDVSNAEADGIDTKATRVLVWGSHVHNVQRNGIKLWQGGDIVNTYVHHTGADAAVVVKGGARARLLHSTVAYHNKGGSTGYNMTFRYDDNAAIQVEIINSIIFNTSGGTYLSSKANVSIQNTLFYGIDNDVILDYGSVRIKLADAATAFSKNNLGSGIVVGDPGLDNNFHQQAGSRVINAGKALTSIYPSVDLLGNPRVKNNQPDLGPFEDF